MINGVDNVNGKMPFCEACVQVKQTRKPFKGSYEVQTTGKLQIVHSDVCGPMSVALVGGAKYFVSFTDDFTRYCRVYFLKRKSEVFEKFKQYEAKVTTCTGQRIQTLRTDNGGKYTSAEFEAYLRSRGIRHDLTTPYTPQQNGVSQRLNRTLQEMGLSQLVHPEMPRCFWADALATTCYVRNRIPVCPLHVAPHEKWYGNKPSVKHMRVFGCIAYALKPSPERKKMRVKSEKMRFIGYPFGTKGYRLYDKKNIVLLFAVMLYLMKLILASKNRLLWIPQMLQRQTICVMTLCHIQQFLQRLSMSQNQISCLVMMLMSHRHLVNLAGLLVNLRNLTDMENGLKSRSYIL